MDVGSLEKVLGWGGRNVASNLNAEGIEDRPQDRPQKSGADGAVNITVIQMCILVFCIKMQ